MRIGSSVLTDYLNHSPAKQRNDRVFIRQASDEIDFAISVQIEGEHGFGNTHAMDALGVGPRETWMVDDGISTTMRLGIYRNTSSSVMATALRLGFPAVPGG